MAATTPSNISDAVSMVTTPVDSQNSSAININDTSLHMSSMPFTLNGTNFTDPFANLTIPGWFNLDRNNNDEEMSEYLSPKDETMLVALIVMGVVVPAIFIFMFSMICWKRHKDNRERREQMLIQNPQDVPMDDIPYSLRARLEAGTI